MCVQPSSWGGAHDPTDDSQHRVGSESTDLLVAADTLDVALDAIVALYLLEALEEDADRIVRSKLFGLQESNQSPSSGCGDASSLSPALGNAEAWPSIPTVSSSEAQAPSECEDAAVRSFQPT